MAKKTVIRRLCKRVPQSPYLADALAHEDERDQEIRDVTPPKEMIADQTVEHDEDGVIREDEGQDQQAEPPRNGQPAIEHRPEQQVGQVQAGRDDAVPAHVIDGPSDDFFTD